MPVSIKATARIGGFLYLLLIALGLFGEVFARGGIIVSGDAAETSRRLLSMESLWRWGVVAEVLAFLSVIGLTAVYYMLFRYVHEGLNIFTAFIRLVATAIESVAVLNLLAALTPLGTRPYLAAFSSAQLQAMSMLAIRAFGSGYELALLFFGCCMLFHGLLIRRSGFLPVVLGWMIQCAGIMYFSYGISSILSPGLSGRLFPFLLPVAFIGEFSLCLWLIFKGVDIERWTALAEASRRNKE